MPLWKDLQRRAPKVVCRKLNSDRFVNEALRGAEDSGLGVSAVIGISIKPEEGERNEEGISRLSSF